MNCIPSKTEDAKGRAALISPGGADAHIELHKGQGQALADEVIRLVETYGFDGLDIDLELSAITVADNGTAIPAALKIVRAHYPQHDKHSIISMAPEFPYLQANRGVNYTAYLQNLAVQPGRVKPMRQAIKSFTAAKFTAA